MAERNVEDTEGEEIWAPHVIDYGYYSALKSGSIDGTDELPHDHAVVRAMNIKYTPNRQVVGNSEKTILVARLSHDTTEEVLCSAFSKYGPIERCRLIRDIVTGRSRGYGFVEYRHGRDMERAYQDAHGMYLDEAKVIVDVECERLLPGWTPRRLGGGLGGHKESGQLRFGGRERPFRKPISLGSVHLKRREDWRGDRRGENRRDYQRRDERRDDGKSYSRRRRRESSPYHRKN